MRVQACLNATATSHSLPHLVIVGCQHLAVLPKHRARDGDQSAAPSQVPGCQAPHLQPQCATSV